MISSRPSHSNQPITGRRAAAVWAVVMLSWIVPGAVRAGEPAFDEKSVTFRNGSVELSGTLVVPAGGGPKPAVVFLHGSGPHTRAGFRPYAEEFARMGIASLAYDKRGTGESGGSWLTSSLDDLATDALAAVDHLQADERIDPNRIGFWGISQAGWVAPVAAAKSDDVAFMILISGGGASPRESELFSYQGEFERAGLSAEEQTRGAAVLDRYFDYLAGGTAKEALLAEFATIDDTRLSPLSEQLRQILPSEENRSQWAWVATHDPASYLAQLDVPILVLLGSADRSHPTDIAEHRWRAAGSQSADDELTVVVFPHAGHGIRLRDGHEGTGRAPFADGYMEVQLGWLWRHVVGPATAR